MKRFAEDIRDFKGLIVYDAPYGRYPGSLNTEAREVAKAMLEYRAKLLKVKELAETELQLGDPREHMDLLSDIAAEVADVD